MSADTMTSARPQAATDQPASELPDPGAGQASPSEWAGVADSSSPEYGGEGRPVPEVDVSPERIPLEKCLDTCGQHFDCPDGWHYGDDVPCSCTPDCAPNDEGASSSTSASGVGTCLHTRHIIDRTLDDGSVVFACSECATVLELEARR